MYRLFVVLFVACSGVPLFLREFLAGRLTLLPPCSGSQDTLQHTATHSATHCNTPESRPLQHTATHTATHATLQSQYSLEHTATLQSQDSLQHTATHSLQHTHCNTQRAFSVNSSRVSGTSPCGLLLQSKNIRPFSLSKDQKKTLYTLSLSNEGREPSSSCHPILPPNITCFWIRCNKGSFLSRKSSC